MYVETDARAECLVWIFKLIFFELLFNHHYSSGKNCEQQCECYNNAQCHHITGECDCAAGYIGKNCYDTCPTHTYGLNCTKQCKCMYRNFSRDQYSMSHLKWNKFFAKLRFEWGTM